VLRFDISLARELPLVTFAANAGEVFHPAVVARTTQTHSTRDNYAETVSSGDEDQLPPGGLTLRHAFSEWYEQRGGQSSPTVPALPSDQGSFPRPHVVEVLQYLRVVFDTESVIDSIPLEMAANASAWHAWKSFRSRSQQSATTSASPHAGDNSRGGHSPGSAKQQQPGGARRPGEWNWQGVWEDRVRKCIEASNSEHALYKGDEEDTVSPSFAPTPDLLLLLG
jgi:hypothetical protein